jgi:hypothetical protein
MSTDLPMQQSGALESQSGATQRPSKRRTFSCNTCRRKKLKCDRLYPRCGRCQDSGQGSTCVYEFKPFNTDSDTVSPLLEFENSDGYNSLPTQSSKRRAARSGENHEVSIINNLIALVQQQAAQIARLEHSVGQCKLCSIVQLEDTWSDT